MNDFERFPRITVEEATLAYRITGITPMARVTFSGRCGCPIVVCAINRGMPIYKNECVTLAAASRFLKLSDTYRNSFVRAFDDSGAPPDLVDAEVRVGYADGVAVRQSLLIDEEGR